MTMVTDGEAAMPLPGRSHGSWSSGLQWKPGLLHDRHGVSSYQCGSGIGCYSLLSRVMKLGRDKAVIHFPILPGLAWPQLLIWEAWDCFQLDHLFSKALPFSRVCSDLPVPCGEWAGLGLHTISLSCMNTQSMLSESS